MRYITQLLYVIEDQEQVFHQFEEIAIPTIAKYNGRLTLRVHPNDDPLSSGTLKNPMKLILWSLTAGKILMHSKKMRIEKISCI